MRPTVFAIASLLFACSGSGSDDGGSAPEGGAGAGGSGGSGASDAPSGDTWSSFASAWFATYCVECHDASSSTRNYQAIADVKRDGDTIRCGVTPTALPECTGFPPPAQFPIGTGPKPSDAERDRLVAWLDAGQPE